MEQKIFNRQIQSAEIRKGEGRKMTFVASDSTKDSAGTVLNQDNWDLRRFNSNGIIGYQHKVYGGYDDTDNPDNIIGKGTAYVEDGKLMVDVEFEPAEINQLAEKIYQKLLFGSLKGVSVGFLPIGKGRFGEGADSNTYYFAGQELLEVSVVNIPANPNALRKGLEMEMEFVKEERAKMNEVPEETQIEEPINTNNETAEAETLSLDIDMTVLQARAALHIN